MIDYKRVAYYYNLPKSWGQEEVSNFMMSKDKYNELLHKLTMVKNKVIYLGNVYTVLGKGLVQNNIKVQGIPFDMYFASIINNEQFVINDEKDIYFIYNIGKEQAINTNYSTKLLEGLVNRIKGFNKPVILCSDLTLSQFSGKYGELYDAYYYSRKKVTHKEEL